MNSLNEEWRDVCGFEGFYQVSSLGRVRSCDRNVMYTGSGTGSGLHFHKGRILKPSLNSRGYLQVALSKLDFPKSIKVHVLVARGFKGERPEGFGINHIDGDKLNNFVDNLEYCSVSANNAHSYAIGLRESMTGENHHSSKLKAEDIPVIRDRLALGHLPTAIASDYGVRYQSIMKIANGKSWAHIT
jgi:hypothetical protein